MKEMTTVSAKRVISEPGDITRYDYFAIMEGKKTFFFIPFSESHLYFPRRLLWDEIKRFDVSNPRRLDHDLVDYAFVLDCNPYTLAECIRTAKEMRDGYST